MSGSGRLRFLVDLAGLAGAETLAVGAVDWGDPRREDAGDNEVISSDGERCRAVEGGELSDAGWGS
jgi:hypothetical protein